MVAHVEAGNRLCRTRFIDAEDTMASFADPRSRRWMQRRLERQERRRAKSLPPPRPCLLAVASLVDSYCAILGPPGNDDERLATRRPRRPPLAVVGS
jgi:hypothetical protein